MSELELQTLIYLRIKDEDLSNLSDIELIEKYQKVKKSIIDAQNQYIKKHTRKIHSISKDKLF
ncbi:hypothetical protein [Anaerococcus tetradius]|uniref:hypothetical protein n=1 Tax=Anaerococcus tetradius TaxID=33036 RepID=UPI0023F21691|nr:hypothetical protein [Anaerococcus tetradius]